MRWIEVPVSQCCVVSARARGDGCGGRRGRSGCPLLGVLRISCVRGRGGLTGGLVGEGEVDEGGVSFLFGGCCVDVLLPRLRGDVLPEDCSVDPVAGFSSDVSGGWSMLRARLCSALAGHPSVMFVEAAGLDRIGRTYVVLVGIVAVGRSSEGLPGPYSNAAANGLSFFFCSCCLDGPTAAEDTR